MSQVISTYRQPRKAVAPLLAPRVHRNLLVWLLALGQAILSVLSANSILAALSARTDVATKTHHIPFA